MDFLLTAGFKVVEWVARFFSRFRRNKEEKLENDILDFMAEEGDWHSPDSIWAEKYLKTVLQGVPFSVAFPPSDLKGWPKFKWRFKWLRFEIRNVWRKWLYLVPEHQIGATMRSLWKRGLLDRASFNPKYYRLKTGR